MMRRMIVLAMCGLLAACPAAADDPDLDFQEDDRLEVSLSRPQARHLRHRRSGRRGCRLLLHGARRRAAGSAGWASRRSCPTRRSRACRSARSSSSASSARATRRSARRRSLIFKRMQIVRGCDAKRNVLVYLGLHRQDDRGSPENSTSAVPIAPWGGTAPPVKCSDWISD